MAKETIDSTILAKTIGMQTDQIFEQRSIGAGQFAFDGNVARVFDDMISRSIPLYDDVQRVIPRLAELIDHDPIRVVDLGCSTGTTLIHLARSLPHRNLELLGVDNSQPMLDKCREKLAANDLSDRISLACCDLQSFEFVRASMVLMNYTLQFINLDTRPLLLRRIHDGIQPGGLLLVGEKVCHQQPIIDDALTDLYFDFKRRNGYSQLEIARKRDALENVLIPCSVSDNLELLHQAGFRRVELLLKWFNFATFIAYA